MAKKNENSKAKTRTLNLAITITPEVKSAIDYIAKRYPGEDGAPCDEGTAVEICILGYHGRKLALDTHKAKKDAVREAKKEGKKLPKGIYFKRYLPGYKDKALDAAGTVKEVATWTHKAPERVVIAKPPTVRKADKGSAKVAASV